MPNELNDLREIIVNTGNVLPFPIKGLQHLFEDLFKLRSDKLADKSAMQKVAGLLDEQTTNFYNANAALKHSRGNQLDDQTPKPKGP